jgi:asparagine synthase (glutamine-hydrolysing)
MCAIVFEYNKAKQPDAAIIGDMLDELTHRGDDQRLIQSHYIKNGGFINVGFRRLAITDTESSQPGTSTDWVIYLNGEIYNYKDLNVGGIFSECKTIARYLDAHGIEGVKDFNGMFVILAINKKTGQIFVARDRYGIKPIYFFETQYGFVFASEIKALLKHPSYKFAPNKGGIEQWLSFNNILTNSGNDTLFRGIYRLEKGSFFDVKSGLLNKYWDWNFSPTYNGTYQDAVLRVRELVINAIKRQTPNGISFGTCLSAGIDSNIINALIPNNGYSFSAGFVGDNMDVVNEADIASKYGKNHQTIEFKQVTFLSDSIKATEDLRVGAGWSNFGLYWFASKAVKVLFDGTGADELFGGYSWRYSNHDYYSVVNRTGQNSRYAELAYILAATRNGGTDTIYKRYKFDAVHFLEGLLNVADKLSMANTIELRVPFLDNDLVDFAVTLPSEWKENKQILKDAFADLLPEEILNQPKRGFSSPDWFSGDGNKANKWANTALKEWNFIFNNPINT